MTTKTSGEGAVMTRAMQVKEKQPIKPLIVPPVKAEKINCKELNKIVQRQYPANFSQSIFAQIEVMMIKPRLSTTSGFYDL